MHKNARRTPHSRAELVRGLLDQGQTAKSVAAAPGVDARTAAKRVARFKAEELAGLGDRSSRPHRFYRPTSPGTIDRVIALRRPARRQ